MWNFVSKGLIVTTPMELMLGTLLIWIVAFMFFLIIIAYNNAKREQWKNTLLSEDLLKYIRLERNFQLWLKR
jgi:hypothetical protein